MTDEKKLQQKILTHLSANGAYAVKVITASRAGIPDILACVDGKFLAIECKGLKGKASPLQDMNINLINDSGGVAVCVKEFSKFVEIFNKVKEQR